MANRVEIVVSLKDNASAGLSGITRGLSGMAAVAGGIVAANVIGKIGEGFFNLGKLGFDGARGIQNLGATLNAYTKDQQATNEMLAWANEEAAKTPFAYEDIGKAIAGLLPAAKDLNLDYRDLVQTAEILGAANPMEGMVGGTFALKEALSGDFTSIIERFNLPRQYINQLKEEGVPNLEIVSRAMEKMGMDIDLVNNLSETFDGRMSTLRDTIKNVAVEFATPIFDFFSREIMGLQGTFDENMPAILETARGWGQTIADSFQTFKDAWNGQWMDDEVIQPIHRAVGNFAIALADFKTGVSNFFTTFQESWDGKWVDSDVIQPMDRLSGLVAGALREGWDALVIQWGKAKELWTSGWIQENVLTPLQDLATFLKEDGTKAVEEFNRQLGPLNELLDAWNKLMDAGNDYRQTWVDLGERINSITGRNNDLQAIGNQRWETTITLGGIIKGIMGGLTSILNRLGDSVKWVTDKLKELYDWAIRARDAIGQAIDAFGQSSANNFQPITPSANDPGTTSGGSLPTGGGGGPGSNNSGIDTRAMTGGVVIYATVRNDQDINALAYEISKVQKANR